MTIWPGRRDGKRRSLHAIAHQGRIEVLESLRRKTIGIEGDILTDEGVTAKEIGDGDEARGPGVERSEGLEEEERLKGSVSRQRRHPPLPVRSATGGGESGDGGHGGESKRIKLCIGRGENEDEVSESRMKTINARKVN